MVAHAGRVGWRRIICEKPVQWDPEKGKIHWRRVQKLPVLMDEVGELEGRWERPIGVVQGRVEVEWKVDALEELPDEVAWYSEATMKCAKSSSAGKVFPGSKTSEVAMNAAAATWGRQIRE